MVYRRSHRLNEIIGIPFFDKFHHKKVKMTTGTASAKWREIDNIDPHGTDCQCEWLNSLLASN